MQGRQKQTNYDEATFNLLFKDELQEKEVARILLEYGIKNGMTPGWSPNIFLKKWWMRV